MTGSTANDQPSGVAPAWRAFAAELGYPVQPGADADAVADLVARCDVLGGAPPREFLELLRDQDGGEVNGLRFFPTQARAALPGLVEVNLDMREGGGLDDHIVLAEGCVCLRALHLPSGSFHELDRVSLDVVVEHPTFHALMTAAIDGHR